MGAEMHTHFSPNVLESLVWNPSCLGRVSCVGVLTRGDVEVYVLLLEVAS